MSMASNPNPPIAVLWDMDGVIIDTGESHYLAWMQILPEYGIDMNRDIFTRTFGMNNDTLLRVLMGDNADPALVDEISGRKEQRFREIAAATTKILPGVRDWLQTLQSMGVRQAIASSAPPANIDLHLDIQGIRPYFDAIVSGNDMPGKPAPDVYLEAARQVDAQPARCVVIEDAVAGVEGARRAKMKCIAVTTTNPAAALASADVIVPNLADLPVETVFQLLNSGQKSQILDGHFDER
ncbi:MAG: HAD family phosphatase [Caldilineales bacterium]|nr:HAD family phosphatase [Caldilineales bacterium]